MARKNSTRPKRYRIVLYRRNGRYVRDWCGRNEVGLSRYAAKKLLDRLEDKYDDDAFYLEMRPLGTSAQPASGVESSHASDDNH